MRKKQDREEWLLKRTKQPFSNESIIVTLIYGNKEAWLTHSHIQHKTRLKNLDEICIGFCVV